MAEGKPLEEIRQTLTNVAPHEVPQRMWSLLETYFEGKYKVQVSDTFPWEPVSQPTIVWRILKRKPGGGKEGILQSRGPSYSHKRGTDGSGLVHEIHTQTFKVTYEFSIFAPSGAEADKFAWDLEQALWQLIGRIQEALPGFAMSFSEQLGESSMALAKQESILVRTLRYEAVVPVRYEELIPELRQVEVYMKVGGILKENVRFIRETSSTRFDIPVEDGDALKLVYRIILDPGTGLKPLVEGTDYKIRTDPETGILYIEWLEDFGLVPAVGESFLVNYELTPIVAIRNITR